MNENHEKIIAEAWFDGIYTQEQAQLSCELQSLSWQDVVNDYARQYEESERAGAFQWN